MTIRHLPAREYDALKAGTRRLVRRCGGGEVAAEITRSDPPRLSKFGTAGQEMYAPIDVVADLESECGDPVITRVLARLSGYLLIESPPKKGDPTWLAHLGSLGKEAGEVIARLSEAMADDGKVTADEVREKDLVTEVDQAMEVLATIRHALVQVESEGRHE